MSSTPNSESDPVEVLTGTSLPLESNPVSPSQIARGSVEPSMEEVGSYSPADSHIDNQAYSPTTPALVDPRGSPQQLSDSRESIYSIDTTSSPQQLLDPRGPMYAIDTRGSPQQSSGPSQQYSEPTQQSSGPIKQSSSPPQQRPDLSQQRPDPRGPTKQYTVSFTTHIPADKLPQDARLFVGNLAVEKTSMEELAQVFVKYGNILEISMKQSFAFVQFDNAAACTMAIQCENHRMIGDLRLGSLASSRFEAIH